MMKMELSQALKNIKCFNDKFAKDEVLCIREHKEEAVPVLLEFLAECIASHKSADEWSDDLDYPMYALYLLAEFGVQDAFDLFIRILELDEKHCEWMLGDCLTEDMGALLGTVATAKNIDRIKTVVENSSLNEFQRLAALRALVVLYVRDLYSREEISVYLGKLLSDFENDCLFVTFIATECSDLGTEEHYPNIVAMFEADKMDESVIGVEEFINPRYKIAEGEKLARTYKYSHLRVITDTVECMQWWYCFNKERSKQQSIQRIQNVLSDNREDLTRRSSNTAPTIKSPKIGRNAPCPCNSGKKYKHCCLGATS
jgi:hypothetical protein